MDELTDLQKETLESVRDYLCNLIPAMGRVADELGGNELEDTWEYLRMIVDGFNWVVEAYNGTSSYINNFSNGIDAKAVDSAVKKLAKNYQTKNGPAVAESLKNDIIPFLEKFKAITEEI